MKKLDNLKILLGLIICLVVLTPLCMIWGDLIFWLKIEATLIILGIFTLILIGAEINNNKF